MNGEFVMGGSGADMCDWIASRARNTSVEKIMYGYIYREFTILYS